MHATHAPGVRHATRGVRRRLGRTAQNTRIALISALIAAGLSPAPADAGEWAADPSRSAISFDYLRAGGPAHGSFGQFTATGSFDPAHAEQARLELHIKSASIDLGEPLASAFATSAEWFDSKEHPEIVYDLKALTPIGPGEYRALGSVTIRGVTRPLDTELHVDLQSHQARTTGSLRLDRRAFGLGVGPSAAFVTIGPEVVVRFDLVALETSQGASAQ